MMNLKAKTERPGYFQRLFNALHTQKGTLIRSKEDMKDYFRIFSDVEIKISQVSTSNTEAANGSAG